MGDTIKVIDTLFLLSESFHKQVIFWRKPNKIKELGRYWKYCKVRPKRTESFFDLFMYLFLGTFTYTYLGRYVLGTYIFECSLFNQNEPKHQILLLRESRQHEYLLLRALNIAAFSTCLLWVLCPVILYTQRMPVEFAIWLPFDLRVRSEFFGI